VLYTLPKQNVFRSFFFTEFTVTGTIHLDMLEVFLILILEEEGPMTCCSNWTECLHITQVMDFVNPKFPDNGLAGARLSLCHLVRLDLLLLSLSLLRVYQGRCVRKITGYHFAGTCCEDKGCCSGYSYPRFI
jgi:hypothetical protein